MTHPISNFDTLVIAPHADDEVFGCGGYLIRLKKFFPKVRIKLVLVACSDIEFRDGVKASRATRIEEFEKVADHFKAESEVYNHEDTKLKDSRAEIVSDIENTIDQFKPGTVLFPYTSFHQDHAAVYESCFAALRPGRAMSVHISMCYEVPNYTWFSENDLFVPNYYVRLDDVELAEKVQICEYHKSQVSRNESPIHASLIKDYASYRGFQIGYKYAEAFRFIRFIA